MRINCTAEMEGWVTLQTEGPERGLIKHAPFQNMLLDQGIRKLLSEGGSSAPIVFGIFSIGSSSQPVQPTDVGVIAPLANRGVNAASHGWDADGGFGWSRAQSLWPAGTATGNISEVATGGSPAYTSAYCRALVLDASGNPATITVLPSEALLMTWELRRWWSFPPNLPIVYPDGDGGSLTTTPQYPSEALENNGANRLGTAGVNGFGGTLTSANSATRNVNYSATSGNPQIALASIPDLTSVSGRSFPDIAIPLVPPIPKTNAYTVDIIWELTLSRRE